MKINKDNFYNPDIDPFDRKLRSLLKLRIGLVKAAALDQSYTLKELIDFEDDQILYLITELKNLFKK